MPGTHPPAAVARDRLAIAKYRLTAAGPLITLLFALPRARKRTGCATRWV